MKILFEEKVKHFIGLFQITCRIKFALRGRITGKDIVYIYETWPKPDRSLQQFTRFSFNKILEIKQK